MTSHPRPTMLCILDGFGLNPNPEANAVFMAKKPCIDAIMKDNPHATLTTFGEQVGLPDGQMGNSEVGHLNIGAGRVVEQWLLRIERELHGGKLGQHPMFQNFLAHTRDAKTIHLVGLFSDGGVHSHSHHLELLLQQLSASTDARLAIHLITDGRDTAPQSAQQMVNDFVERLPEIAPRAFIATMCGRFFAMDRDKRWERVQKAFDLIVSARGTRDALTPAAALAASYAEGNNDEFVEPVAFNYTGVDRGDGIIFWNFRADRMREIARALTNPELPDELVRSGVPFQIERTLAFTDYEPALKLPVLFGEQEITNHLGQVIAAHSLAQFRAAETEKYPHVTYFFNGGREEPCIGEERRVVPSPRDVKTYDLKPEMSAYGVAEAVCAAIRSQRYSFFVVNFANADMVGHTGVLSAAISAVQTVDSCLGEILAALAEVNGQAVIIADHGNCDQMIDYDTGVPHTAHTTHPVPIIVWHADPSVTGVATDGALCDVAPTVLELMGLAKPQEMTGRSLLVRS